jgi:glycosyl transferase family 25
MIMQILVINLENQTQRLQYQQKQLGNLKLPFVRIAATDAEQAQQENIPPAYWETWQRPMTWSERACFLSHQKAWKSVLTSQKPALILEDDAVLSDELPSLLAALASLKTIDHISLEYRGRKKLLAHQVTKTCGKHFLHRLYLDRSGAAAYILWPSGAQKLLKTARQKCALADAMLCQNNKLRSYQVVPAPAIQLDMLERCGGQKPEYAGSSIGDSPGRSLPRTSIQRIRRIWAQLQMGWRQIKAKPSAQSMHIPIDKSLIRKLAI